MAAFLAVEHLAKVYPDAQGRLSEPVFEDVGFGIERGEFVCIIGHSGCGKTTILSILAGLEQPSEGLVIMDGREVVGPSLERGVVFQGHALMPWLTVRENIVFAVRSRWTTHRRAEVFDHAQKYVDLVGLAGAEHKKPAALSGGLAALGGAYLALDQHQFTAEMTAGRGFIALAAIIFGRWDPARASW